MEIEENLQKSLQLANGAPITDQIFKSLIENTFQSLTEAPETHHFGNIFGSKPDVVKELYAALLSVTVRFIQSAQNTESVIDFFSNKCHWALGRTNSFLDLFVKHRVEIEGCLINIGTHLPHITDVNWKIDYIIKSNYLDDSGGPLFRIGLQTEKFDEDTKTNKIEFVKFSCDSRELQDLVYKLKDIVRHCQRIATEH